MKMSNYAPVFIITLNRAIHFRKCIESLSKCISANHTDIFIYLDFPKTPNQIEGYNNISEFLSTGVKGFNSVRIIKRKENYGRIKNYLEAEKEMFDRFERVIFTEDDNVFSEYFLLYMNAMFEKYNSDPSIYSICGYHLPVRLPDSYPYDIYFYQSGAAWGVGYWRSKFIDVSKLRREELKNKKILQDVKRTSKKGYYILKEDIISNGIYGDARVLFLLHKYNMFAVFPIKTLVQNIGHDGSGVNCGISEVLTNNKPNNNFNPVRFPDSVVINKEINELIRSYKNISLTKEILQWITNLIKPVENYFEKSFSYQLLPLTGSVGSKIVYLIYCKLLKKRKENILVSEKSIRYNKETFVIKDFLEPNKELKDVFKGYEKFPFVYIYIHGSWADNTRIPFSDLDDFIIINGRNLRLFKKLRLERWMNRVEMKMNRIDPLQHHGHWVIYYEQLNNYDNSYMPIGILENSVKIQGPKELFVEINFDLSNEGVFKNIYNCIAGIRRLYKKYEENQINIYEMKSFIGSILLIPPLVFQFNGKWVSKKYAIENCNEYFSVASMEVINQCSELRRNWECITNINDYKILKFYAKVFSNAYWYRLFAKNYAPKFPQRDFKIIDKHNMEIFINEALSHTNK